MEKKRGQLVRILAFLLIGAALFWAVQAVLTPDWVWPHFKEYPENALAEFTQLKDSDIQAVFLGTSLMLNAVSPMRIYEKTGLVTYNLSTSAQPIEVSYYMLKECFKTQSPQYVFLDVNRLTSAFEKDAYYRYVIDAAPLNKNKLELAKDYIKLYPEEKQLGAFIGAIFPLYRYHDRWNALRDYDFTLFRPEMNYFQKGLYMNSMISPSSMTVEKLNDIAQINAEPEGWTEIIENGQSDKSTVYETVYAPTISQDAVEILLHMDALCKENGAQLKLVKIPTCIKPQSGNTWTEMDYNLVKGVAEKYSLPYLDLLYDLDPNVIGIDWSRDTCDGGSHLNFYGTQKISDFFANYLQTEGLTGQVDAEYEADLPLHHALSTAAELQMAMDLTTYLQRASEMEGVTVFLSAMDDMMSNLSEENRQDLKDFGLRTDFNKLVYSDSYLAVKEGDTVLYEASGNRRLTRSGELTNGVSYTVTSCGWRAGAVSSIKLDGVEYSMNKRGINIVVLDNRSGLVLDSVVFDTWNDGSQSGVRSTSSTTKYSPMGSSAEQAYFFDYEDFLLRNGL